MPSIDPVNESVRQYMKIEHYRLHCAEEWPDSPYKKAVLAAVHSALTRLEATAIEPFEAPACMSCATRTKIVAPLIMFPRQPNSSPAVLRPAA
jgi:hypothetical protein